MVESEIYIIELITGNGNVVKPKVISYLKKNNFRHKIINNGCFEVKLVNFFKNQ